MASEHLPQGLGVDPPSTQRSVETSPSATMGGLETQMSRRRGAAAGSEDCVRKLEEGIGPTMEAFVE